MRGYRWRNYKRKDGQYGMLLVFTIVALIAFALWIMFMSLVARVASEDGTPTPVLTYTMYMPAVGVDIGL